MAKTISMAELVTASKTAKSTDGVGAMVRELLVGAMIDKKELTTKEILAAVKEKFPTAKTTAGCVAWYRSDLRNNEVKLQEVAKKICEQRGLELK